MKKKATIKITRHLLAASLAAALCWHGTGLKASDGGEKKDEIALLQERSAAGEAEAAYQLGKRYFNGKGVEKDEAKAVELTRAAAEAGHPEACTNMGYFYSQGVAVEKDEAAALEWFRKAAELGSARGMLNLGVLLRQGKTISRDNEESLKWLTKAAESGLPEAVSVLGRIYFAGDALQPSRHEAAIPLLRKAAEGGDPVAQNMLGLAYRDGYGGVPVDHAEAERLFRAAAEQGEKKAQANLAKIMGVEDAANPRRKEALKWLIIAANQREATARKVLETLRPAIPAVLLQAAEQEANRYMMFEAARQAKKKREKAEE